MADLEVSIADGGVKPANNALEGDVLSRCNQRVDSVQQIADLHIIGALPRSGIGKLPRRELKDESMSSS